MLWLNVRLGNYDSVQRVIEEYILRFELYDLGHIVCLGNFGRADGRTRINGAQIRRPLIRLSRIAKGEDIYAYAIGTVGGRTRICPRC